MSKHKQPSAFVLAAEALVRDIRAFKIRASFKVIEGGRVPADACHASGPAHCNAHTFRWPSYGKPGTALPLPVIPTVPAPTKPA